MGFLEGFVQGVSEHMAKSKENKDLADREKAKLILQGIIEGNLQPTTNPQEAMVSEPAIIKRGFLGTGIGQQMGQRYYTKPKIQIPQVKKGEKLTTHIDEKGKTSYSIAPDTSEKEMLNRASNLRREFQTSNDIVKRKSTIDYGYKGIEKAYQASIDPNTKSYVAVDNMLGTLFQKITDPSTGVREQEFQRIPNGVALYNKLSAYGTKLAKGGLSLTPQDRLELVKGAKLMLDAMNDEYNAHKNMYSQYASDYGVPAELVIGRESHSTQPNQQTQQFNVGGKVYNIPADKVEEFKTDMGIK